jgi:copper chaperone CopZ
MASVANKTAVTEAPHNGQGAVVDTTPSVSTKGGQTKDKGAFPATLGSLFTAIVASACCWLPLLLIAFGFSAAGVGSFFEQYRPHFLCATFMLLAVAWYLTYRAALLGAWARLTGKPSPPAAVEACCATETPVAATHSCCATPQTSTVTGQPVRQRFSLRRFNQVMLWVATAIILLFALFPQWVGLILGSGGTASTETTISDGQQQIVLKTDGMSCEGCAATVQQALLKVPGVTHADVNYSRSEAVVTMEKCCPVSPVSLIQAVRDAGYNAQVKK